MTDKHVWPITELSAQIGARPAGARLARIESSMQYAHGRFRNIMPTATANLAAMPRVAFASMTGREDRRPHQPVPLLGPADGDAAGLHVTWYGHSSVLVELDGHRVLLDPVWSRRASPSRLTGPKRLHEPPITLREMPPIDAVVISHDHYDHLDMATVQELSALQDVRFVVPLGIGAHLQHWGVPAGRITELDWHESTRAGELELTATPARHFSGRGLHRDETLWASWVIKGPAHRAFYSGDTGYFPGFSDVGTAHGPFDVSLVQVGAYDEAWPDIHMLPEDGVRAHLDVRGGLLIPVHWATFDLALHSWADPADRTWRAAKDHDVRLAIPRPGERVNVDEPPAVDPWWQLVA
ncbi:MBL fold metallo-hydrolase [Actinoplanes sp. GCM10030250]|uniref:MBL fold metallo-hydrolase n=1 Tax=Actinoplanes sp. GCM10030250 TaxID=3273376 RepID=UPI0036138B69